MPLCRPTSHLHVIKIPDPSQNFCGKASFRVYVRPGRTHMALEHPHLSAPNSERINGLIFPDTWGPNLCDVCGPEPTIL